MPRSAPAALDWFSTFYGWPRGLDLQYARGFGTETDTKMQFTKKLIAGAALLVGSALSFSSQATIVEFRTSLGNFEVNLFDETTPETVANFLKYVEAERYDNSVIHRLEPDFVIQGGGLYYSGELPLKSIRTFPTVKNEKKWSNRRGTIAMAKIDGQPDSANSQWFFNLKDNHEGNARLDSQNGGFTVFGQISEQGLEILDEMAKLKRFNMGGAATSIPLRDYTAADAAAGKTVTADNLVMIESIVVIDDRPDTAAGLSPVANEAQVDAPVQEGNNSSSGGAVNFLLLLLLPLAWLRRRVKS